MFFEKLFQSVQVFHPTIPDDLFSRSPWQKAAQIDIEEHQRLMDAILPLALHQAQAQGCNFHRIHGQG